MSDVVGASDPIVMTPPRELDIYSAATFLTRILEALAPDAPTVIVVDLADVVFVDSTGLSKLIDADRQVREAGGRLRMRRPQSQLLRLLSMTQTYQVFDWA